MSKIENLYGQTMSMLGKWPEWIVMIGGVWNPLTAENRHRGAL